MNCCSHHKKRSPSQESPLMLDTRVKMRFFIFTIACAFLHVSRQNPTGQWTLLPHVLVADVDGTMGQLTLSCLEELKMSEDGQESRDIFWMKNGVRVAQTGNSYVVWLEESLGGGNYTCYSKDGSLLNHTVVLIHEDETKIRRILVKADQEDYLKCSTQNYNGEFHCSWTWHSSRVGKVAFVKARRVSDDSVTHCSVDSSGRQWTCFSGQSNFVCSVDDSGDKVLCVDQQHCPYAEETQQISFSVYVTTKHFLLENYSKQFFLSDIVKPDKVRISKINTTMIEWSYPSSWSSPFSYFPLTFQIAQLKQRCKRCDNPCTDSKAAKTSTVHSPDICQFEVKHRTKAVCIRAKDALCDSQWSEWSHLRLKKDKKNKRDKKQA